MKLVVLNVAYPFSPVGPYALGRAEQLLTSLDAALAHSGHESFVMACEGSITEGILLATPKPSRVPGEAERHRIHEQYRFTLRSFLEKWPIDLIHMHGADFYEYLPDPGVPVLVTLHLPVDQYPETIFHLERPQTFLQCVTVQQRNACPPCPYLLPEIGSDVTREPTDVGHGARFLDAGAIDKYFSIYERLVGEARALEEISQGFSETRLAGDILHA
jgi:glycosyl transferase family 4